jgi:uncharacterized membrane protein YfcA
MVPFSVTLTTKKTSLVSKLGRVDWIGGFLFIGGMTSMLVGLSWGGVQYPWGSPQTIFPICFGLTALIVFLLWEAQEASEPILRRSLFHCSSAVAAYLGALCQGFVVGDSQRD